MHAFLARQSARSHDGANCCAQINQSSVVLISFDASTFGKLPFAEVIIWFP